MLPDIDNLRDIVPWFASEIVECKDTFLLWKKINIKKNDMHQ